MIVITDIKFEHINDQAQGGIAGKTYINTVMGSLLVGWTPNVNQQFDTIAELQGGIEKAVKAYVGKSLIEKQKMLNNDIIRLKRDIEMYSQKAEDAAIRVVVKKEIKPYIIPKEYTWDLPEPPKFAVRVVQTSIIDDVKKSCKKAWSLVWGLL